MAARKIGPALAAGCTTILKPASETPLTALAIAALMEEAGLPAGVVNVLPSRQSGKVVSAMLADPRVRKLSFTGSTEVGRTLLNLANEHIVNCSMELGGNAPFVVFADADLDAAHRGRDDRQDAQRRRGLYRRQPVLRRAGRSPRSSAARLTRGHGRADRGARVRSVGATSDRWSTHATRTKVAELVDRGGRRPARPLELGGRTPDGPGLLLPTHGA